MYLGEGITDQPLLENIPEGTAYLVEAGDGSGTKHVKHETVVKEVGKALPIGDMEELEELRNMKSTEDQDEPEESIPKGQFTLVKAILKVLGVATKLFSGTDGIKAGTAGMVPPPTPEDEDKFLKSDGTWATPSGGGIEVNAEKVKFTDGMTAEEKIGMIEGATADLNCENDNMVAMMSAVKKVNDSLLTKLYPVGAIYISVNDTDPSDLFGGVWERIMDRFLLAAGNTYNAGNTGGAATVTLTTNQIPSHNHSGIKHNGTQVRLSGSADIGYGLEWTSNNGGNVTINTGDAGGGQAHNNMPPYLTVYMWKRVG